MQRDRTETDRDRCTEREGGRDKQTDRQTDRQTETETEKDRGSGRKRTER